MLFSIPGISSSAPIVLFLTCVFVIAARSSYESYRKRKRMPPGPGGGLPFLGNKYQVPAIKPWRTFQTWNQRYGPVISFFLGRTPVIVLGTAQAASDLLDKRSDIYSSRPRFVVAGEILSDNMRGLMLPYGDAWRKWRKVLHTGFHSRRAESYTPIQSSESKITLKDIMERPENWERHLQRYAASVVTLVSYARRVDSIDEWIVKENMDAMDYLISVNIPGKYLVESWPWLLKLPRFLQWFRAKPERQRQRDIKLYTTLYEDVKRRLKLLGEHEVDCLTTQTLINEGYGPQEDTDYDSEDVIDDEEKKGVEMRRINTKKGERMSELDIAYAVSSPFGAGIETTAGTLSCFILAMLHYPEVMHKAQSELDEVVGSNRLPEFTDKDQLPYVQAVVKETLRWRPIAVLGGTAHALLKDDEYNGMFIPKGSTVFANLAGIMHDPTTFPSPDLFHPERFFSSSPLYNLEFSNPFDLPFGFGRRICPGMHLARNSIFMNIARLLWAFEILPALDDRGQEIMPDPWNFTNGFNSKPVSFRCRFIVRGEGDEEVKGKEALIWREGKEALDNASVNWK